MKFVYFDYGGSHSSVIAANIHVGKLSSAKTPTNEELIALPLFDKTKPEDLGKMQFIGQDENDNEVYLLGSKHSNFAAALDGIAALSGTSADYIFAGTMPYVNPTLRIGGFLSRGLSMPFLGRPLVFRGIKASYPGLASLVDRVKLENLGG